MTAPGLLPVATLEALPGIRCAVTTRALGDLKSAAGWSALTRALGVPEAALVRGRQVHGIDVALVDGATRSPAEATAGCGADILATRERGRFLVTLAADCAPVALADPVAGAVAVAHAGWRGVVAGAAGAAVRVLAERLGGAPAQIVAAIGPCIGPCCYEVGPEVTAAARARPGGEAAARDGRLDLPALIRADLVAEGVRPEAIHGSGLCTRCRPDLFYSFRGARTEERFGLAIGIA